MEDRTECMGWGQCPQRRGGVRDTGCTPKTNKGTWLKADNWDAIIRLESVSLEVSGEDAAAAAWTCLYLPQEGGWREASHNAKQPASGQPQAEGKEV